MQGRAARGLCAARVDDDQLSPAASQLLQASAGVLAEVLLRNDRIAAGDEQYVERFRAHAPAVPCAVQRIGDLGVRLIERRHGEEHRRADRAQQRHHDRRGRDLLDRGIAEEAGDRAWAVAGDHCAELLGDLGDGDVGGYRLEAAVRLPLEAMQQSIGIIVQRRERAPFRAGKAIVERCIGIAVDANDQAVLQRHHHRTIGGANPASRWLDLDHGISLRAARSLNARSGRVRESRSSQCSVPLARGSR